jgi:hypothetical protein
VSLKTLTKAIQQRDAGNGRGWQAGNGKGRQAGAPLEVMISRQAGDGCSKTPKIPHEAGESIPPPPKKKSFPVTGSLT